MAELNFDRKRYNGIRVGDIVTFTMGLETITGIVSELKPGTSEVIEITIANNEKVNKVAKYCRLIILVQDVVNVIISTIPSLEEIKQEIVDDMTRIEKFQSRVKMDFSEKTNWK